MNKKRIVRAAIGLLLSILVFGLALEAFLWFVDPLGIATFVYDLSNIQTIPNAEGYTLAPGVHYAHKWSYTIDADGNRVMPSSDGACTIRFVGDSVAFGMGVNDEQSFAYKLALDRPGVHFINAAKISYNEGNIGYSVEHSSADGYVYLMSDNDQGANWGRPESDYGQPRVLPPRFSAFRYYIEALREMNTPPINDWDTFWASLDALEARSDILIFAVKSPLSDAVVERYPALTVLPRWSTQQQVSWIDIHPNVDGHQYLYNQMVDAVDAFVDGRCEAASD